MATDRRSFLAAMSGVLAGAAVLETTGPAEPAGAAEPAPTAPLALLNAPAPSGGDDTAALHAALRDAQSSAMNGVRLQAGTYRVSGLSTEKIVDQPVISGQGAGQTVLHVTGTGSGIRLAGRSGGGSGAVVQDLSIHTTHAGSTGLEFNGTVGARAYRINFTGIGRGVLFSNTHAGDYTEFCVVHDSFFSGSLRSHIEYVRGAGNESFHGTGFKDCVFNQQATDRQPKIRFGRLTKVYNAPFDGAFFLRNPTPFVEVSPEAKHVHTYGAIRTEGLGTGKRVLVNNRAHAEWFHAGTASHLNQGTHLASRTGSFRLAHRVQSNKNGTVTALPVPYEERWTAKRGTTSLIRLGAGSGQLVSVTLTAAHYEMNYLLYVWRNLTNQDGVVKVLAAPRRFDRVRYGSPRFTVGGGRLRVRNTRFPRNRVHVIASVVPITSTNQPWPLL